MRAKTVKRFFCDHCSKGMFRKKSMERHESICFHNPNRSACILCELHKEKTELPTVLDEAYKQSLDALRTAANHCPACIFSAIIRGIQTQSS